MLGYLNIYWDFNVHRKIKGYFYIATTEDKNNNWGKHQEKLASLKAQSFFVPVNKARLGYVHR